MKISFASFFCVLVCFLHVGTKESAACLPSRYIKVNLSDRFVWPKDKSQRIPLNTAIIVDNYLHKVSLDTPYREFEQLRLREKGGKEIESNVRMLNKLATFGGSQYPMVVLTPKKVLSANTNYEVLSTIGTVPCGGRSEPDCIEKGKYHVISSFRTGNEIDKQPPQLGKKIKVEVEPKFDKGTCQNGRTECCDPGFRRSYFSLLPMRLGDENVHYNVYLHEEDKTKENPVRLIYERYVVPENGPLFGAHLCSGSFSGRFFFGGKWKEKTVTLSLRAVDMAGNESEHSDLLTIRSYCGNWPEPKQELPKKQGCGCHQDSELGDAQPSLWWCTALVVFFLLRRRRYRE